MYAGLASKLAGALSWGPQRVFRCLGRAMLWPLFKRKATNNGGRVPKELRLCLQWWLEVLKGRLHELVPLVEEGRMVAHLFCDARGFPGRLAGVAFIGNDVLYTDFEVPDCLLRIFRRRKDNQLMGLELSSIAFGLSTFSEQLRGKMLWCGRKTPVASTVRREEHVKHSAAAV
jgi:hypothetical protein